MKYSDFITLPNYFKSFYNLQDEVADYWKQFVPTRQFTNLLSITIDAVRVFPTFWNTPICKTEYYVKNKKTKLCYPI
jgi:hypothetical protein